MRLNSDWTIISEAPIKDKYYANNPTLIDACKNNIRLAISEIGPQKLKKVLKSWDRSFELL